MFIFLQLALLTLSIVEVIMSVRLLLKSEGLFIGGIYAGIPCAFSSLLGIFSLFDGDHKFLTFISFVLLNACSFIVAIVATALMSQLSISLGNLSSCSYYNSPPEYQCQYDVNDLSCVGDPNSYIYATNCAIEDQPQYQNLPPYANPSSYDIAAAPGKCWCVSTSSLAECVSYTHVPHCSNLFSAYPVLLDDCFVFCFPLIIVTALLFCFRDPRVANLSPQNPLDAEGLQGIPLATIDGVRVSRQRRDILHSSTDSSVMVVAANAYLTDDIIAADAEYSQKPPVTVTATTAATALLADTDLPSDVSDALADDMESSQIVMTIEANGDVWVTSREGMESSRDQVGEMVRAQSRLSHSSADSDHGDPH